MDPIPLQVATRKRASATRLASKPVKAQIRVILGHSGMLIFIGLLIVAQFARYYVIRTGHCDIDGCISKDIPAKNLTYEGECSLCRNVWLDEYLIDRDDALGSRYANLRLLLILLYINMASYLLMSLGSYFYNPNFLIVHLIIQSIIVVSFVLKVIIKFSSNEESILANYIFCQDFICMTIWSVIYMANIGYFCLSVELTKELDPLRRFNVLKEEFKLVAKSMQEHWTTTLTEPRETHTDYSEPD